MCIGVTLHLTLHEMNVVKVTWPTLRAGGTGAALHEIRLPTSGLITWRGKVLFNQTSVKRSPWNLNNHCQRWLVEAEKTLLPPIHVRLGFMKNLVKSRGRTLPSFRYLYENVGRLNCLKLLKDVLPSFQCRNQDFPKEGGGYDQPFLDDFRNSAKQKKVVTYCFAWLS